MGSLERLLAGHGRVKLALDEGGVRCTWSGGAAYVPWALVADVTLDATLFGGTLLCLVAPDGEQLALRLDHADPLDLHREMLVQLAEVAANVGASVLPAPFARGERALDAWLDAGRAALAGEQAYRGVAIDRALVASVLADEHAAVEARAVAAHALLAEGADDDLVETAKTFVLRALPPLVLVAARLARGGAALVDDEIFDDALPFLGPADREVAAAARAQRDPEREASVVHALERAKTIVAEELRAAQSSTTPASPRWRRVIASTTNDTRWIGRTWN